MSLRSRVGDALLNKKVEAFRAFLKGARTSSAEAQGEHLGITMNTMGGKEVHDC